MHDFESSYLWCSYFKFNYLMPSTFFLHVVRFRAIQSNLPKPQHRQKKAATADLSSARQSFGALLLCEVNPPSSEP